MVRNGLIDNPILFIMCRGRFDRGEDLNEGPGMSGSGFDANNIFQMFFNQGGGSPFGG